MPPSSGTRAPAPHDRPVLVSACLAGVPCRYDGRPLPDAEVVTAVRDGRAVPLCPEELGGLSTPRPPAEIVGGDGGDVLDGLARVLDAHGNDVTDAVLLGAHRVADDARRRGITHAVLQARSPSCGCGVIHDGSFSGRTVPGDGVLAALLGRQGVTVEARRGAVASPHRHRGAEPADAGHDAGQ